MKKYKRLYRELSDETKPKTLAHRRRHLRNTPGPSPDVRRHPEDRGYQPCHHLRRPESHPDPYPLQPPRLLPIPDPPHNPETQDLKSLAAVVRLTSRFLGRYPQKRPKMRVTSVSLGRFPHFGRQ